MDALEDPQAAPFGRWRQEMRGPASADACRENLRILDGSLHTTALVLARGLNDYAAALSREGDHDEVLVVLERALSLHTQGEFPPLTIITTHSILSACRQARSEPLMALSACRVALEQAETHLPERYSVHAQLWTQMSMVMASLDDERVHDSAEIALGLWAISGAASSPGARVTLPALRTLAGRPTPLDRFERLIAENAGGVSHTDAELIAESARDIGALVGMASALLGDLAAEKPGG